MCNHYYILILTKINLMDSIRMNITLPKKLVRRIKREIKTGKTSSFIADAVENKLNNIKKDKLN